MQNQLNNILEIYNKQKEILIDIIKPTTNVDLFQTDETIFDQSFWKIIIFDQFNCDLMSLQLRIGDVRQYGVTLMLQITQKRQIIEDVPAIYVIQPTKENIDLLINDMKNKMYANFTICFSTEISTELLQYFAEQCVQYNIQSLVNKIQDLHINYHLSENTLFTLSMNNSYKLFNDPTIPEQIGMKNISMIVDSLMSICVTLKEIPIIRARAGTTESVVAQMLTDKLHLLNKKSSTFFQRGVSTRPLLILTNRNFDISTGLMHGWNYQALIKEVHEYKNNRIKIEEKWEDIGVQSDFWNNSKFKIMPDVSDLISLKVKELKHEKDQFQVIASSLGLSFDENAEIQINENDQKLLKEGGLTKYGDKMTSIRELNKEINLHSTIASNIIEQIKSREIDLLYSYEENFISNNEIDINQFIEFISRLTNENDIIRLFYIYLLNTTDYSSILSILEEKHIELKSLNYIKKIKQNQEYIQDSQRSKKDKSFGSTLSNFIGRAVQNLITNDKILPITNLIDTLTECKRNSLEQQFDYYDPKISISNITNNRREIKFNDSILFIIGGGNYYEYCNIQQYATKSNKRILYGSTDFINGNDLLDQINQLSDI